MRSEAFKGWKEIDTPPDLVLARFAARQHGLVTLAQLRAAGLSQATVTRRLETGRLHRTHRGVYAVGHHALSQAGVWMAAVLASGPNAVLSHLAAATLWQVWRRRTNGIQVTAPRRRESKPGMRVHCCRRLDPRDVTKKDGIPVTTVARTLVDLTDVLTAEQLANVIHEAAFRERFDPRAAREAISRANGRHNLAVLERALMLNERGSAGTKSALEDRFLALIEAAGLPDPLPNVAVQTAGRRIEVDFLWPDRKLCVEIDGPGHVRTRTRNEDRRRDRDLEAAGHEVLRFTGAQIENRPHDIVARVGR